MAWWAWAVLSVVAAAATTILAKVGVTGVPSTTATAIRTVVVLVAAWGLVFALGEQRALPQVSRRSARVPRVVGCCDRSVVAGLLSRAANGASHVGVAD